MTSNPRLLAALATLVFAAPAAAQDASPHDAPGDAELLEMADDVLDTIQDLRGVYATGPIESRVASRASLRQRLVEMVELEYAPEELAHDERSLRALGLLRDDQGYLDIMLDLLEEQIAGFYDDREKVFYILDDMDLEMQVAVMSHELFHAVQDQVLNLQGLREASKNVTDIMLARTALIEGDALAVMMDFSAGGAVELENMPMLESVIASTIPSAEDGTQVEVPEVLWDQLIYPYIDGMMFVFAVARERGWDGVDRVYFDAPVSSEQVLHPERYLNRDDPTWVSFDIAPAIDGERYEIDVFGEFTMRSVMHQLLDGVVASSAIDRAMDGWDGDRTEFWRFDGDADRDLFVQLAIWDDVAEAEGFFHVAERLGIPWVGPGDIARCDGAHGARVTVATDAAAMLLERWGDMTVLVLDTGGGASSADRLAQVSGVAEQAWATRQRSRYPAL